MTSGEIILALIGFAGTLLGIIAVFRRGSGDSIDRKRESEIARLDGRVTAVETEMEEVRADSRIVAAVAIRAIRYIEHESGDRFAISDEEREALERTRPLV